MTSHPNRNRSNRSLSQNPTAAEVRAARERAGFSLKQAGETIFKSFQAWQKWESGDRTMSAADFCLFLILTGQASVEEVAAASEAQP
jgi:DNA-binding transcriptional regulator YiaG